LAAKLFEQVLRATLVGLKIGAAIPAVGGEATGKAPARTGVPAVPTHEGRGLGAASPRQTAEAIALLAAGLIQSFKKLQLRLATTEDHRTPTVAERLVESVIIDAGLGLVDAENAGAIPDTVWPAPGKSKGGLWAHTSTQEEWLHQALTSTANACAAILHGAETAGEQEARMASGDVIGGLQSKVQELERLAIEGRLAAIEAGEEPPGLSPSQDTGASPGSGDGGTSSAADWRCLIVRRLALSSGGSGDGEPGGRPDRLHLDVHKTAAAAQARKAEWLAASEAELKAGRAAGGTSRRGNSAAAEADWDALLSAQAATRKAATAAVEANAAASTACRAATGHAAGPGGGESEPAAEEGSGLAAARTKARADAAAAAAKRGPSPAQPRHDAELLEVCRIIRGEVVDAGIRGARMGHDDAVVAKVVGLATRFRQVLAAMPSSLDAYSTSLHVSVGVRGIIETGIATEDTQRFIEELLNAIDEHGAAIGGPPAAVDRHGGGGGGGPGAGGGARGAPRSILMEDTGSVKTQAGAAAAAQQQDDAFEDGPPDLQSCSDSSDESDYESDYDMDGSFCVEGSGTKAQAGGAAAPGQDAHGASGPPTSPGQGTRGASGQPTLPGHDAHGGSGPPKSRGGASGARGPGGGAN
jgi:hypothetical protein